VLSHTLSSTACDPSRLDKLATLAIRSWASANEDCTCSCKEDLADTKS
jgi:hypothetical protein